MPIIKQEGKIVIGHFKGRLCAAVARYYVHDSDGLIFKTFAGFIDGNGIFYPEFEKIPESILTDN